jgi:hypothetical protein
MALAIGQFSVGEDTFGLKAAAEPSQGFPPPERIPIEFIEQETEHETMEKGWLAIRLGCLECLDRIANHIELLSLQTWSPSTRAHWVDHPRRLSRLWLDAHLGFS